MALGTNALPPHPSSVTFSAMSALAATYKFTAEKYYRLYEIGTLCASPVEAITNGLGEVLPKSIFQVLSNN